jgi:hypothetical protein
MATTWNPSASSFVNALTLSGSTVYAGGQFNSIGGQPRNNIAALDVATGNATSWNPGANNTIWFLASSGSTVYVGGFFTEIGNTLHPHFAGITTGGTPIPTASLQLWLRADAGVDTLNGTVSRWHDQSGNGNDAIQASSTRQPLLVAGALNGKPVLRFDGLNDKLGFTGTTQMTQFSLFVVIKNQPGSAGNSGNVITFGAAGDFSHQWYMGMYFGPDTIGMGGSGNYIAAISPSLAAYDTWRNLSVATTGTLWNTTLQWNGSGAQMVPTLGSNFAISVPLGDATGSGGGIGGADGVPFGTILAKCDVAEVLVYNVALSDSVRRSIESYLATKYNLPVVTGISVHQAESLPERFVLEQNYPNPFNPSTTLRYGLPQSAIVTLTVYNTLGQRIAELVNGPQDAGYHEVKFDASGLASGAYFYRLQAGTFIQTRKLLLLR